MGHLTIYIHTDNMYQVVQLAMVMSPLVMAGPLVEGFGSATDEEIAQIRGGTYGEMYVDNPTYNYNYKVADDTKQTYMSMSEEREDNVVTGSYSYVDPEGSLITVTYTSGAMGYTEEREVQPGFVQIRPVVRPIGDSSASSGTSSQVSSSSSSTSSGS